MPDLFSNLHPVVADLLRRGMADARARHTAFACREFEQALMLDPECVEALLWLAALAPDGETSLRYLSRALEINPREPRAHAGIRWARKRLPPPPRADQPTPPAPRVRPDEITQPSLARRAVSRAQWMLIVSVVACVMFAGGMLLLGSGNTGHVDAAGAPTSVIAQVTPTATMTPSATATASPMDTPTSTVTPIPTATPPPTDTPAPTDTPLPPPTDTPVPLPTDTPYIPPPPTAELPPAGGDPSSRWIDVNLSAQSVTAYEGDTPLRTFTVSTGLPNTPTVTGQFRIYLRYDSQTMSGPGYYLPGVEWVQYFYQGYALHGTYWHNNFGRPMSHGCINMTNADALWLYQWADYGTIVNIHY